MENATELLKFEIATIPVQRWLLAVAVAVVVFAALRIFHAILVNRLQALASRTVNQWDDVLIAALRKTKWALYFVVSLYAAGVLFLRADALTNILTAAAAVTFLVQCGLWANAALASWLEMYRERKKEEDLGALTHLGALRFIAVLLIWSAILLLVLDNLGVRIGPIIAGMGVGGIAVALAVQNILGDLFASLSIVLDKPFVVGDFLVVDSYLGKVEKVGLKTTRIRSLSGEQLVFSNNDLLTSRLRNYGRMYERRVVFKLGVVYQTSHELLGVIPQIIREAIEAHEKTRFDRCHFQEYGDFSLNFETVYFVLSADYNLYMDIQQEINLTIYEKFADKGIEFAYPTQTLFIPQPQSASGPQRVG